MPSLYENDLQRADEMDDIITAPPSWILRRGIGVYFMMLILFITLSSVVKYPDVIKTQLVVRSTDPGVTVNAVKSGYLTLFVRDGQVVKRGQLLAQYPCPVPLDQLEYLLKVTHEAKRKFVLTGLVSEDFINRNNWSGSDDLEEWYREFSLAYMNYKSATGSDHEDGSRERVVFIYAFNSLKNKIAEFRDGYFLKANTSGKVSFDIFYEQNRTVGAGQALFYIEPQGAQFLGTIQIPQQNIGKVRNGQRVIIKLRSYPFEEFGILEATVRNVGTFINKNGTFSAMVKISESSDAKKKGIQLKDGMLADAEIITQEVSAFERITRSLMKIFK